MASNMAMLCSKAADGSELALDVVRELKHPLTAALAYVVLLKRLTQDASNQIETAPFFDVLEQIEHAVARCNEMVQCMRPFTASEAVPVRAEELGQVVAGSMRIVERAPHTHTAIIDMQIDDPSRRVVCDPGQIEQALANLIINAVEAAEDGSSPEITIRSVSDHDQVEIIVEDNGRGVAPANQETIFAPFASTKASGIGLGLTICRSIVEAVGGRIWCETREAGGAAFHFTLPSAGPRPV
jgi:two-component system sensor kinase FixL